MPKLFLSLSGGGFRATLFHVGVVLCLRNANLIKDVERIVSVSGGSILAAFLVENWETFTDGSENEVKEALAKLFKLTSCDLRNRILRRWFWLFFRKNATEIMVEELKRFYSTKKINELCNPATRPSVSFLSTCLQTGCTVSFDNDKVYSWPDQYSDHPYPEDGFLSEVNLATAVAASAAYTAFFPPLEFRTRDNAVDDLFGNRMLTDGGVYDNLGAETLMHFKSKGGGGRAFMLISDAGRPLGTQTATNKVTRLPLFGLVQHIQRAVGVMMSRVQSLVEFDVFELKNGGVQLRPNVNHATKTRGVVRIQDECKSLPDKFSPLGRAERFNAMWLRTDLNRFSELETSTLVQHGYDSMAALIYGQTATGAVNSWLTHAAEPSPLNLESIGLKAIDQNTDSLRDGWEPNLLRSFPNMLYDLNDRVGIFNLAFSIVLAGLLLFGFWVLGSTTSDSFSVSSKVHNDVARIQRQWDLVTKYESYRTFKFEIEYHDQDKVKKVNSPSLDGDWLGKFNRLAGKKTSEGEGVFVVKDNESTEEKIIEGAMKCKLPVANNSVDSPAFVSFGFVGTIGNNGQLILSVEQASENADRIYFYTLILDYKDNKHSGIFSIPVNETSLGKVEVGNIFLEGISL